MKKTVLIATLLVLPMLAACGKKEHAPAADKVAPSVRGAGAETVKMQPLAEFYEAAGTIRSSTSASVSSRIPGIIIVIRAKEGTRVKKGDLLAQLDARENQANAAAAVDAVEDARRALEESKARKILADALFERYQKLFKSDVVSRQEFEVKTTEKELAHQGVARAEARLKQSKEQASGAGAFADYTKILAPISGIITARQADLGATLFPGQPLFTIEDESGYQLELAIPESMLLKVSPGTVVQVTLDAVGSSFTARIAEIVPSADPVSRTFTAKVPLSQKGLKSGLFGRGAINLGTAVNGVTVPGKAVFDRGALSYIWVLDKENFARMRIVKVGKAVGERVEILAGLADGERVVTSGLDMLSEGAKVE